MTSKEQQLDSMLKREQRNQLSSEQQEDNRQLVTSKSMYRKPIKDPFSNDQDSDSDLEQKNNNFIANSPFLPPKPPQQKSALQQVQGQMKWDKNQQIQTQILTKLDGQGMKDKKIRELASKYRALNVAYEKQRTLRRNLQNQLNQSIKTSEQLNKSGLSRDKSTDRIKKKSLEKSQLKTIDKCQHCAENQKKVMEFRLKSQNMKTQVNKITRLLTRQLGENFDIDKALNQQNGWKGRQQKIERLKSRIKQLQDKLNNNGINVSHMSGFTQVTTNANRTNANFQSTRTSAMVADNKRKQLDNLRIQVDALKNQNELLHGKVKSLTSRKLTLENQIKQFKSDFEKKRQLFIQKSDNDDKFISLLKNENEKLKKQEKVVTKVIYKDEGNQTIALKRQIQNLKKKIRFMTENQRENRGQNIQKQLDTGKEPKNQNPRVLSADKKKQLQDQYLRSNKYLKKMTNDDEQQLYKNWKNSINRNN